MNIKTAKLHITMPDGSVWAVPLELIARNRAEHYKDEFDNDLEMSLNEDTWPMFESDNYEATDWAANNMDWSDVEKQAVKVKETPPFDFEEGWRNGEKRVVGND